MHISAPEIDMSELESLFPASNASAEQADAKLKSRAAIANKPEKIQLVSISFFVILTNQTCLLSCKTCYPLAAN